MVVVIAVIFVFSLVQSLFGMGLLLFGTPTLLLMGHDFSATLSFLLPASLTISVLQRYSAEVQIDGALRRRFLMWCLPWVGVALALRLAFGAKLQLDVGVALFLLLAGFLRISGWLDTVVRAFVVRFEIPYLAVMGMVHGLTNMGGSLLSVFASTKYAGKARVLGAVSLCYLYFAAVQLLVLAVFEPHLFGMAQLGSVAVAAVGYLLCGRRLFTGISEGRYRMAFTVFIFAYAVLLLARSTNLV